MSTFRKKLIVVLTILSASGARASVDDPPAAKVPEIQGIESLRKALRDQFETAETLPVMANRGELQTNAAMAMARIGDHREAQEMARRSYEVVKKCGPDFRAWYLLRTASVYQHAGDIEARRRDVEDALEAASSILSTEDRLKAWAAVAPEIDSLGDRAKALQITEWMARDLATIEARLARFQPLDLVISTKIKLSDREGALKIVRDLFKGDEKSKILYIDIVVRKIIEPGAGTILSRGAETPEDRASRRDFLLGLVEQLDGKETYYIAANRSLAEGLAILGDYESAEKIVRRMSNIQPAANDHRLLDAIAVPEALISIGKARFKNGLKDEGRSQIMKGLELVRTDPKYTESERNAIKFSTAMALAEISDFDRAIQMLELDSATRDRSTALRQIGELQFNSGDVEGARTTNLTALRMVEKFEKSADSSRPRITFPLGRIQFLARLGRYDEAEKSIDEIKDPRTKQVTQLSLGRDRAKYGDLTGAVSWASKIEDPMRRAYVLNGIVGAIAPDNR